MVLAGSFHLFLNIKPIKSYLKKRGVLVFATIMSAFLVMLLVAGLNKTINPEVVDQVQQLMLQMESTQ